MSSVVAAYAHRDTARPVVVDGHGGRASRRVRNDAAPNGHDRRCSPIRAGVAANLCLLPDEPSRIEEEERKALVDVVVVPTKQAAVLLVADDDDMMDEEMDDAAARRSTTRVRHR